MTDERKKILIVSTNADWAGAPIHVLTLATAMRSNFDIEIVFGEDGPVRTAAAAQGIACTVLPTLRSSMNPLRDFQCLLSFLKIARAIRPNLLHAHSSKAGMVSRLAAFILRLPCVYTVHGWGFGPGRTRLQSAMVFCVERVFSYVFTASYIFVSNADRLVGLDRLGLDQRLCQTIHNGMPDHGFRAQVATNSTAIMAARVCHAKDHQLLLHSFQNCTEPFRLVLVGDGTNSPGFHKMVIARAPSKHDQVECLGVSSEVPQLLARAGIFVLCSRYEGLPLSIIEAMCAGLPIVATNVGGVAELVEDGVNGFLVPAGDHVALSNCLDRLQRDTEVRVRMGQASRDRYLAYFTDQRMVESVADSYLTMLDTV